MAEQAHYDLQPGKPLTVQLGRSYECMREAEDGLETLLRVLAELLEAEVFLVQLGDQHWPTSDLIDAVESAQDSLRQAKRFAEGALITMCVDTGNTPRY